MNKHGHSKTLVAAQPGNRNAVKHGVYSPRTLAPRIDELEQAIGALPAETAALHILRRELAGLLTLSEAVDQALADDGIRGRGGEPRTLVSRRLRVNEMIRRTTQQYIETAHRSARPTAEDADEEVVRADAAQVSLPATVAARHGVHEIEEISPKELDPEFFLEAVIATEDASVTLGERVRARRLLNRRRATQPPLCTCIATLPARDEAQLQEWINRFAETAHQSSVDTPIAVFVRRYRTGQNFGPWATTRRSQAALADVIDEGLAMARDGEGTRRARGRRTGEHEPSIKPFWLTVLSSDPRLRASARLQAFEALDDTGVLPRCNCKPDPDLHLIELEADAYRANVIRVVAQRNYRAAQHIARHPETYAAGRELVDQRVAEAQEPKDGAGASASRRMKRNGARSSARPERP